MIAGMVAAGVTIAPIQRLWNGDVAPLLFTALVRRKDILDISTREVRVSFVGISTLVAIVAQATAIGLFGLTTVVLGGFSWLSLQVVIAGVLTASLLFAGARLFLFRRYSEDLPAGGTVNRDWAICAVIFAITYIVVRTGIFLVLYL